MPDVDAAERAFDEVLAFLRNKPWFRDSNATLRALRFNLTYMAGWDVEAGESSPPDKRVGDLDEVIKLATSGDRIAFDALCDVADRLTTAGESLPPPLQRYIVDAARVPPRWRKARHPLANLHRDDAIFHAVELVVRRGFKATKNEATDGREPACSIVARALMACGLKRSETTVAGIWGKRWKAREKAGFRTTRSM